MHTATMMSTGPDYFIMTMKWACKVSSHGVETHRCISSERNYQPYWFKVVKSEMVESKFLTRTSRQRPLVLEE